MFKILFISLFYVFLKSYQLQFNLKFIMNVILYCKEIILSKEFGLIVSGWVMGIYTGKFMFTSYLEDTLYQQYIQEGYFQGIDYEHYPYPLNYQIYKNTKSTTKSKSKSKSICKCKEQER